jgi:hypothetical protein
MKKLMVKPGRILCLCAFAVAVIGCSGKNKAGQTELSDKVAELTKQLEAVTSELESAQTRNETTGRDRERRGRDGRNVSNEEQTPEAQAPLDEMPLAASTDAQTPPVASVPQTPPTGGAPPAQAEAAVPAAPRYTVGDKGPGGGIVFSANNGTYKEVSRLLEEYKLYYVYKNADGDAYVRSAREDCIAVIHNYRGGGYADWKTPSIDDLELINRTVQKTGAVRFSGLIYSGSSNNTRGQREYQALYGEEQRGDPGYRIILAGMGGGETTFFAFDFTAGKEYGWAPDSVPDLSYFDENGEPRPDHWWRSLIGAVGVRTFK